MNTNLIKKELESVMKKDYVETWLKTPNPAFSGKTPLHSDGDEQKIREMIYYVKSGEPT